MSAKKNLAKIGAAAAGAVALLSTGCGSSKCPQATAPAPCKNSGDICTVAGQGTNGFLGDECPAYSAYLSFPMDMAVGPDKLLYIMDWNNHRVRRVDAQGDIHTLAGTGEISDTSGVELPNSFNHPVSLTFDSQGRAIIAAWHNSRLKRLDPKTGVLENICGTGKRWYSGDDGPAAQADLDLPSSVAIDANGDILFMDQANQLIRKVDTSGNITRVAGQCIIGMPMSPTDMPQPCPQGMGQAPNGKEAYGLSDNPMECQVYTPCAATYGGDNGPALEARLAQPVGQAASPGGRLVLDQQGNIIFADTKNNRIRKIDTNGIITTIAGNGTRGYAGDNGPAVDAQINGPVDVDVANDGTVYFADTQNHCIRDITPDGNIHTFAGQCTVEGYAGDGGPALSAQLDTPFGIFLDRTTGNLYIADTQNNMIRMVKK